MKPQKKLSSSELINIAKKGLVAEADAIKEASTKISDDFYSIVQSIATIRGKVVVSGLGKSGHVARKVAATLASTGTSSVFLHPSEALHGDLGVLTDQDALLAIAFGGETSEVVNVAKHAKRLGCFVASITGKLDSSLAKLSDKVIDGSINREVCPLNLAPTASTSVAMALGDALAISLMYQKGFTEVDFASLHPGGTLGRKLSMVSDHMREINLTSDAVFETSDFYSVLAAVTKNNFGIVPVLSSDHKLIGAISDGDIRRAIQKLGSGGLQMTASQFMTQKPKTVEAHVLALDAFSLMEKNQITSLFVLQDDKSKELVGIIRMHDLLAAKVF
ncbi:MAG: KpsF/GutQ family sugar-phosphate isomerase [Proteobacteria bacterium]|nr:KpsF/GutQ family sugar-phosphate isomerase [Pseudomonadota bacterium]